MRSLAGYVMVVVVALGWGAVSCGGGGDSNLFGSAASVGGGSDVGTDVGPGPAVSVGSGGAKGMGGAGGKGAGGKGAGGEGGKGEGGKGSSGGAGGCLDANDCSDGFSCTIDVCNAGVCEHSAGPNAGPTACPADQFCNVLMGCVPGVACSSTAQCETKFGSDACKTNVQCDKTSALCTYQTLDNDQDNHPPPACGGDDCNDNDSTIFPGAPEICDGKDNNCNGQVDEAATCPGVEICEAGACSCPAANTCLDGCVDITNDPANCGFCENACPTTATCVESQCVCAGGETVCGGLCVNLKTDPLNCNACDKVCGLGFTCANGNCACSKTTCSGACIDTTSDNQNCGGCNKVCQTGSTCTGSTCICNSPLELCKGQCVDTTSDNNNCNGCGIKCGGICQNSVCNTCPLVDLYILQDVSGSLTNATTSGPTRLQICQTGIESFMTETKSANLGLGIGYWGILLPTPPTCTTDQDCGGVAGSCVFGECLDAVDSCTAADYAKPVVPMALLPGIEATIANSLNAQTAATNSTPPPGLAGALSYVKSFAVANPTHVVGLVMIADGMPNECTPNQGVATDLIPIATQYATGSPKVLTYVVGISADVPKATWDTIAVAGGTGTSRIVNSALDVQTSLEQIRDSIKLCP